MLRIFKLLRGLYFAHRAARFARRSLNATKDAQYYMNKSDKYNNKLQAVKREL